VLVCWKRTSACVRRISLLIILSTESRTNSRSVKCGFVGYFRATSFRSVIYITTFVGSYNATDEILLRTIHETRIPRSF